MNQELWKDVHGYEGMYKISNKGRVKSFRRNPVILMHPAPDGWGYPQTVFAVKGKNRTVKIHRLVAENFIPNPENLPQVNHKDGNKENNSVENLEWCTGRENIHHYYKTNCRKLKVSTEDVKKIRAMASEGIPTVDIANIYKLHRNYVNQIVRKATRVLI